MRALPLALAAAALAMAGAVGYLRPWLADADSNFDWGQEVPWPLFTVVNSLVNWLPLLQARLLPPHANAIFLATGFAPSKALYALARLGVADALKPGPMHVSELARLKGVKEDRLQRLLRAVGAHGIFKEVSPGLFANNRGSSVLRSDHPTSLTNIITVWGDESHWAHEKVYESLQLGSPPAFQLQTGGVPYFDWLGLPENAQRSRIFNQAMTDAAHTINAAKLADFPWHRHSNKTVSDVGGGIGGFLAFLLQRQPTMRGLLVDRSSVVAHAEEHWQRHHASLLPRVNIMEGDFFSHLPQADIHFLRYILHDWNDESCRQILHTVRAAVPPGSEGSTVLLIQDIVMPERQPLGLAYSALDLQMLAIADGKERTQGEWEALLRSAGFRLAKVYRLRTMAGIIEAHPV